MRVLNDVGVISNVLQGAGDRRRVGSQGYRRGTVMKCDVAEGATKFVCARVRRSVNRE